MSDQAIIAGHVRIENAGSGCILHLGPCMDLRAAAPLRDALMGIAPKIAPVRINADEVTQITTPCIRVLLAAQRSLEAESRQFVLDCASESFVKAFADLGLFSVVAQWSAS